MFDVDEKELTPDEALAAFRSIRENHALPPGWSETISDDNFGDTDVLCVKWENADYFVELQLGGTDLPGEAYVHVARKDRQTPDDILGAELIESLLGQASEPDAWKNRSLILDENGRPCGYQSLGLKEERKADYPAREFRVKFSAAVMS